jgi:phospholipase A-2-activating protein
MLSVSCVVLNSPLDKPSFDQYLALVLRVRSPIALYSAHLNNSFTQVLESETADSEAVYRALVGLGNTVRWPFPDSFL